MLAEFSGAGFLLTADDPSDVPDAVVVGFDMTLVYARVCRAAWWIQQGKLFVATNPDRVCPTDEPTVLVDCGSICALLEKATGRGPDIVLGKPDPAMLSGILERHGLRPSQIAMVGDRIYASSVGAKTFVFEATPASFKLLAQNQLGDEAFASPVICGGRVYLRVARRGESRQEFLYCIGEGGPAAAALAPLFRDSRPHTLRGAIHDKPNRR